MFALRPGVTLQNGLEGGGLVLHSIHGVRGEAGCTAEEEPQSCPWEHPAPSASAALSWDARLSRKTPARPLGLVFPPLSTDPESTTLGGTQGDTCNTLSNRDFFKHNSYHVSPKTLDAKVRLTRQEAQNQTPSRPWSLAMTP